jgi:redox-sensitive bicupin YhaK (pirin superfamily)
MLRILGPNPERMTVNSWLLRGPIRVGGVWHATSLGNRGVISSGDAQSMTAGRGIIHQETPKGDHAGRMHSFQLWANLPSTLKIADPHYKEVKTNDGPEVTDHGGTHSPGLRIILGKRTR